VFGIGRDVDGKRWRSVFRQLVARNFLSVDLDRFGALRLEPGCRPLLRGEERIALREDPEPPRGRAGSASGRAVRAVALAGDIDPVLYDALRDCRMRLAQEQQVPPYVIFNNATLEAMCRLRPRSLDELVMCTGVGSRKLERYGKDFLEVLEAHFA